jgi:hypothetical protein
MPHHIATSTAAFTRLSYTATPPAFAGRCHVRQVSPCTPAPFRCASAAHVCGIGSTVSRRPWAVLTTAKAVFRFHATQALGALPRQARFRVAQPRFPVLLGIESKDRVTPSSARRSRTSAITRIRLQHTRHGWWPCLEPFGSREVMEFGGGQPPNVLRWKLPPVRVIARALHHFGQPVMQGSVALVLRRWSACGGPGDAE